MPTRFCISLSEPSAATGLSQGIQASLIWLTLVICPFQTIS
ncbi:hypothetical protein J2X87_002863 [Pseudomonas synxantha]|uniref:Uncharacterized protein n=1 Tax=Pseudomonas synxantha TaxID=47883 RepID=A0ACC6JML9_9PSED|nr:hypothetical protein [Pseudomonas synxantha]